MQKIACVLLVDDDEITNYIHESLISEMGITEKIIVAQNGRKALDLINQNELQAVNGSSLILLDINMPVMNGIEFLAAYQQLEEDFKQSATILILTTSQNPKDIERVENMGVADFLNKPLSEEKLRKALEKHF